MTATLEEISARMIDGDTKRGEGVMERIGRLAATTDAQQQFMYQTVLLRPEDARDFLAFLASEGILIAACPIDEPAP